HAGHHGLVGVAGVAVERAARLLELLLRDVAPRQGLADLRLGGAAGEDRHGEGEADLRLGAVRALHRNAGRTVPDRTFAVACAQAQAGQVPGARGGDTVFGGAHRVLGRAQRRIVL